LPYSIDPYPTTPMKLPCFLLSLALAASASAAAVLSNTGNTSESIAIGLSAIHMPGMPMGGNPPMMGPDMVTSSVVANSFTTSNQPLTLDSVALLVDSTSPMGLFNVYIYTDIGGVPGTSLAALTAAIPGLMPSVGENIYTLSGGLLLEGNTTYWLFTELSPVGYGGASVGLEATTDLSETSADGHTIGTVIMRGSMNGNPAAWSTEATRAIQFAINPIPEPTSAALIMLSGGLLLRRNRSRRVA